MRASILLIAAVVACGGKTPPPQAPDDDKVKSLQDELTRTKDELQRERAAAEALRASDSAKADETKALQDKLAQVVGQMGEVTTADGAVRLELVDQILFSTGEADLTDKGREVLAKVGDAVKELDKQIWVQGHTDDAPIFVKKPVAKKPDPKAKKDPKKKVAEKKDPKKDDTPDMVLAYMTNWELSAARALTVVHYLQDEAKIDPTRLAAVAFSQYRPVSKQRAKNRRIEIVLYPRVAVLPK
jgi:chemotaxis protein MotB